ncbi:hypothetical protein QQ045_010910 [Rhodiola kirilowii]
MDLGHMRIGATRAFHLVKEMVGGYSNIGATLTDFNNFKRDMKAFIGGRDAAMVETHLKNKRDCCKGYVFEYVADEEGTLTRLFWADSKLANDREMFVKGVSSNATYSTNKKSIFHCPSILVTDQDPAMKAAIAKIFPESTHRFCMWHIAEKMKAKVLQIDFMKNISTTIWSDHIDAVDFEEQWKCVIEKYGLEGHIWLSNIYKIRTSWIPVYLKNVHMGKLLRTTSISESENSFFGRVLHNQMTLVKFYMVFHRALYMQRNNRWTLDNESTKYSPILKTELDIERHAANIFTHNIFKEFQNEIFAGIPSVYILNRWLKSASSVQELVPQCSHPNQEVASVTTEIRTLVRSAISQSESDLTNLRSILENVKQLRSIIQVLEGTTNVLPKANYFKIVIGMEQPSQVNIEPTKVARNKRMW